MKREPADSDFEHAWQQIEGRKTAFDYGWKLVEDGDEVYLAVRPYPERVATFDASLSVSEGVFYAYIEGKQISVSIEAIEALLRASKRS